LKEAYAGIFAGRLTPEPHLLPRRAVPQVVMVVTRSHEGIFLRSLRGVIDRLPLSGYELTIVVATSAVERVRSTIRRRDVRIVAVPDQLDGLLDVIVNLRADVLYYWEIGTDMLNYFLPFYRLAPVQCTSWGVQVTSGIPSVDYYLSSALVEPSVAGEHYSETLLTADTLLTYQFRQEPRNSTAAARWRRSEHEHLYLTAQHAGKLHPDFDELIIGILRRDPRGVFVTTVNPAGPQAVAFLHRLNHQAADVADRVRLVGRLSKEDYFSLLQSAHVVLDPPHFGGVNSTYDAVSLSKPIVTCPSAFHRGRYTAACLLKMEMSDGVVEDGKAYIERAVQLGTDAEYRLDFSRRLSQRQESLFEDPRAVSAHEELFHQLIEVARCR